MLVAIQGSTEEHGHDGQHIVLRLEKAEQTFVFTEVSEKPVLSALRSFSAPIKLEVGCLYLPSLDKRRPMHFQSIHGASSRSIFSPPIKLKAG
jgi:hypothetical protein